MYFLLWCLVVLALVLKSEITRASLEWPAGKYGLLKPVTGCPGGWKDKGWILQDTLDGNNRSEILHIDGYVARNYVTKSICINTFTSSTDHNLTTSTWPKGKYCMYTSTQNTLHGLKTGSIDMYGEQFENKDASKYTDSFALITESDLYYESYTQLYFSCQTSGDKKTPIELPITKPFYLLPYGSRDCQQVKWMLATTEWIEYHTRRKRLKSGAVPFHEVSGSSNRVITMYYCYYESCKYTLTKDSGVFQSPGFPLEYPDGQLCSWRIMVPANHTVHVNFTNFSLYDDDGKDKLTFYRNISGIFQVNDTFHGEKCPFTLKASHDLLFEFLTNKENSNTGFRAEYIISPQKEATLTTTTMDPNTSKYTTIQTTPMFKNQSSNRTSDETFKKLRVGDCDCDGTWTTIALVIPLVCLTVFVVIAVIVFCRWRSKESNSKKCQARFNDENTANPTYDHAQTQRNRHISTTTSITTLNAEDDDERMYESLSRDQQPEYQAPDYSKQNGGTDSNMDPECPEYHELEPVDHCVPDVVYDVLEGPGPDNGPSGDQVYQALDTETTQNPVYQSANPATMVTRNRLYVDSVA